MHNTNGPGGPGGPWNLGVLGSRGLWCPVGPEGPRGPGGPDVPGLGPTFSRSQIITEKKASKSRRTKHQILLIQGFGIMLI